MSRPCIFTVFNLNEVYLPLVDINVNIELLNSVYISAALSWVWHLVQMRSDRRFVFFKGVTKMASGRLEVSLSLADKNKHQKARWVLSCN